MICWRKLIKPLKNGRPCTGNYPYQAHERRAWQNIWTGWGLNAGTSTRKFKTLERVEILRGLRLGEFDVADRINLLREGLESARVSLVAILDADKEGFLRSENH